jgi:hypothetical protein
MKSHLRHTSLLALFLACLPSLSHAERVSFHGPRVFDNDYYYLSSITTGDLDNDGKADVIGANLFDPQISVLFGKGDGTFGPPLHLPTEATTHAVAVGLLNNDSNLDIVAGLEGEGSQVIVFFGDGAGHFEPQTAFIVGMPTPGIIITVDVNEDHHPDLICSGSVDFSSRSSPDFVTVTLNNGDGTFNAAGSLKVPVGGETQGALVGEFNGDNHLDLAAFKCANGEISIILGSGTGSFFPAIPYDGGFSWGCGIFPGQLAVGQFNGDDYSDLALSNHSSSVFIALGGANGVFSDPIAYGTEEEPDQVIVADFNHDHEDDLAVATQFTISVLLGNGDGTFKNKVSFEAGYASEMLAVDLNGDEFPDLVYSLYGGGFAAALGNGDGTFKASKSYFGAGGLFGMDMADFNLDHKPDAAVIGWDPRAVAVLPGLGDGSFDGPINLPVTSEEAFLWSVTAADIDGVGGPDLAVNRERPAGVDVYFNQGNFAFSDPVTIYDKSAEPAVGDFDQDSLPDIALVDSASSQMVVRFGRGNGAFGAPEFYQLSQLAWYPTSGNLNDDPFPDLVLSGPPGIQIMLNSGNGAFSAPVLMPGGGVLQSVISDVDNDGRNDIVGTPGLWGNGVILYLNLGEGRFAPPVTVTTGFAFVSLAVEDFDGDGWKDLAVTRWFGWRVLVFPGLGGGQFGDSVGYAVRGSDGVLKAADLNGDLKPELIMEGEDSNWISVLVNTSSNGGFPDFNENHEVGADDLTEMLRGLYGAFPYFDLSGDKQVDEKDLIQFSRMWHSTQ